MKKNFKRGLALFLAVALVVSGAVYTSDTSLKATSEELEAQTEQQADGTEVNQGQAEGAVTNPDAGTQATDETGEDKQEIVVEQMPTEQPAQDTTATQEQPAAAEYDVVFHKPSVEGGSLKLWADGKDQKNVSYDGNGVYTEKFTENTLLNLQITANEQYTVEQVTDQNGVQIAPLSVEGKIYTYQIFVSANTEITTLYKEVPQTNAEEPAKEEDKTSKEETAKDADEKEKNNEYTLHISHVLHTSIGNFHDEADVKISKKDFTDGSYNVLSQVSKKKGIELSEDSLSVKPEDFSSNNEASVTMNYEVSKGWKAESKTGKAARSIYVGTFDDVEIVPGDQMPVTVTFTYENGALAAPTQTIMLGEGTGGYDFNYEIPAKDGYTIGIDEKDKDTYNLNGNILSAHFSNDVKSSSVNVTYLANDATYKVDYMYQRADGSNGYDWGTTEIMNGKAGELTEVQPPEKTGFTAQSVKQLEIKADGSTVVTVEYVRNTYSVSYHSNGGSYVSPVKGLFEQAVKVYGDGSATVDPVREGYTFAGWYSDEGCTTSAEESVTLTENKTVYAKWNPGEANYTVVYFKQVWDNTTNNGYYVYTGKSEEKKARVGDTVKEETRELSYGEYPNYKFGSSSEEVVRADGKTVVTVKYDLIEYTIEFGLTTSLAEGGEFGDAQPDAIITLGGKVYKDREYKIKAVVGQNISDVWPDALNIKTNAPDWSPKANFTPFAWKWQDELQGSGSVYGSTMKLKMNVLRSEMLELLPGKGDPNKKTTYIFRASYIGKTQILDKGSVTIWLEQLDGTYKKSEIHSQEFPVKSSADDMIEKEIQGYTSFPMGTGPSGYPKEDSEKEREKHEYNFYYKLNAYQIEYVNGDTTTKSDSIPVTSDIKKYDTVPKHPENVGSDYTFKGWYDNALGAGEKYEFTEMPDNALRLYAIWEAPKRDITLDYGYKTDNGKITVDNGATAEIPTPEREGYLFEGWFTDKDCKTPFDYAKPIEKDITIYAKWTENKTTTYTVRYVVEDKSAKDGYRDIADAKTGTGIVGNTITEKSKLIEGEEYSKYVVNKSSQALELKSAASQNEILFVYSDQKDLKYTVQYTYKEKVLEEETGLESKANQFQVYPNKDIVKELGNKGYALNEVFVNANLGTVEKENIITFTLSKKEYKITYEGLEGITGWNGATGLDNPNKVSYTTDDEFTLKNPVKEGFEFDGWEITSGTEAGGSKHDPLNTTIEKGSSGNLVFNAVWKENSFTVKYDTKGGTPAAIDDRTNVKWTDKGLIPASNPTKTGYNFLGWTCQETLTDANADSTYSEIVADNRELKSILLIARWERDMSSVEVIPYEGYYDGQAHSVEVKGTVTGDRVQYTTDFSSVKPVWSNEKISYTDVTTVNEGRYPVKVRVVSEDGQYVTKIDSYIQIKPVEVKIKADSDSKEYDGTPLTKNSYSVEGTFVGSDGLQTVVVEGSCTAPGQSDNIVTSYTLKDGTNADNYQIGKEKGTLTITDRSNKLPLNIKGKDDSPKYDGTEKTLVGFETNTYTVGKATYTVEGLEAAASGKDVNVYIQNVTGKALVRDADGNDVTSQFAVTVTPGKLTIGKRSVSLTSGTASKQYDGTPLTKHTVTVDGDGFVEGEGAEYTFTGEQTIVGNSSNTFTYTLKSNTKAGNYSISDHPGMLSILNRDAKYEITVVAKSDKVKYDGKPHSVNGFETLEFAEGTSGKKFTVSGLKAEAKGTDADTYSAVVTGIAVVKDENDKDVTSQFTVKTTAGTLKIDKREVTLTSGTKSKVYDGTPVTDGKVTVGKDGFAEGEGAIYNVTGTQTAVGNSSNTFSYDLNQGTKAANYTIKPITGTLTVTSRGATYEIDVKAKSGSVEYDGEIHSVSGLVAEEFYVGESKYTITGLSATASGENAGTYVVNVNGTAIVRDADGNDVTSEFKINPVAGKLTIKPRLVTMESATDNKVYDGAPLTNAAVTEGGSGFVTGQGATYNVTGSQTLVGYSDNSFTYALNQGTIAENYDIRTTAGVLTVKNRDAKIDISIQAKSHTATYDGNDHTISGFIESKIVVNGQEYTITGLEASVTGKDAAVYRTNITGTAIVTDAKGNNVSDQFNVTPIKGTLTINPRLVTMISATESKDYDGTPLTNNTVTEGGKGFVEGEGVTYTVTGTRTLVGSTSNSFTYLPKAGTNLANYDIKPTAGTLTINNRNALYTIKVKGNSDKVLYDGTEHVVEGVVSKTFTENGQTFTVEGLTASTVGIDAGDYPVNVIGTPIVRDAEGNDVTDQFKVEVEPGTLKIDKRTVTLTSSGAEKEYDGTPLTNNEVIVGGDKFANSDGASFTVTGTQTVVGVSGNTFTYTLNDGTMPGNYIFKLGYGTLNVKVRDAKYDIIVEAKSDTVTYDGKEHAVEGFKTLEFTKNGQKFTVAGLTASARGTNAGKYILEVTGSAIVRDSKGNDVSNQFSITPKNGELRINERKVTLTSGTDTKTYDGKALTNKTVDVTEDGFADGEGATYKVTGSQKVVGSSNNTFEYTLTDKTKLTNYIITPKYGTLTVESRADEDKYKIKVEANSDTVDYDGDAHTVDGIKQNTFTVDGETYTVEGLTASVTGTDAVIYDVNVNGTAIVKDSDGKDVSGQFAVTPKKGTLTINKRTVTLTSTGDSKVYDGAPLTNDEVTIGGQGFVKEEGATWKVTGTQTVVGTSSNYFTYDLKAGTNPANYTITPKYGMLTVTNRDAKYEITLEAKSDTVTYDGKEHEVEGFETLEFTENGQKFTVKGVTAKAAGTNADTYAASVTGVPVVTDAKGNDVTDQFQVHTADGTLKINQRNVVLTSATDTKKYDGKALTNKNVEVSGDKFAEGEGAAYKVTGSQKVVGVSNNEFEYTLTDKTNPANYIITPKYGLLTVTNRDAQYKITVEANSDTVDYDGDVHTVDGIKQNTFTVDGETYTVEGLTASVTGTDAVIYDVNVNGTAIVKDSDGKDVSGQFAVTPKKGTLTINKRTVTLTSTGDSKVYDGAPLTNAEVTIGGQGFVKEEGATWKVTGTQTVVGTSSNYFTYDLKAGTNPANYTITPNYGTLTVTNRDAKYEITLEAKSDTVTYDGKEHTVNGFKKQEFVVDGQTYKVDGYTAEATGTNADVYTVNVTGTPVVTDIKGNDVTDQFAVHTIDGTLSIEKRNVMITAESDEKTYDGAPLENADSSAEASTSTTGLVEKDTYTAIVRGSQTYVGESANKVTGVKIVKANKTDVTANYEIIPADGILKVKDGDVDVDKVVTKTHDAEKTYKVGDTVVFNITVTNIYNENKTITIEEQNGVTITGLSEFNDVVPGAVVTTTASYVVTEADVLNGTFKNTVTAKFSGNDKTFKNEDTVDKFEDPNGHMTVNKITTSTPKNGATYALGETISYQIEVKNDGNLTLKDVVVTDALTKGEWTVGTLAPGETSRGYTTSYVVTEKDILNGSVLNEAVADGTSPDQQNPKPEVTPGQTEDGTDTPNGHLTVEKNTISTPANGTSYVLGEKITYKIVATNDGNLTLKDVKVTDTLTGDEWTVGTLKPGESSDVFEATHKVTEGDILNGFVINEATATGKSPDQENPEAGVTPGQTEDQTDEANGHLAVVKEVTSTPENGAAYALGEEISYKIVATNDGNLALKNVVVKDELTGDEWTVGTLKPGEKSDAFETTYKVTEGDILNGKVLNVATAAGESPDPEKPEAGVTPGEKEVPTATAKPSLFVEKTAVDKEGGFELGDTISYTIKVVNNGNVTVSGIAVKDDLTGGEWTIDSLAPNGTQEFTTEYVVTEADIMAGQIVNVAAAQGTAPDNSDISADGSKTVQTGESIPHLSISKEAVSTPANGTTYALGEAITYKIVARNDGNLTLTNIVVTDDLTGAEWTIDSLAPGQSSEEFTTSYVVTSDDILNGSVLNVATAAGESPDPEKPEPGVTPGEKEVTTDDPNPNLTVVKEVTSTPANGTTYALGETIRYKVTVSNKGNVPVENIVVDDSLVEITNGTISSLLPGESKEFTYDYVVKDADIRNGKVVNTATASTGDETGPKGEDTVTTPTDPANADYTVNKDVVNPQTQYEIGDTIQYKIEVSNTGNLILNNVVVTDNLQGASGEVVFTDVGKNTVEGNKVTILEIAPGETVVLNCRYEILREDAGVNISNIANVITDETEETPREDVTEEIPVVNEYTLTINYRYAAGGTAAPTYVGTYTVGQQFGVTSPTVAGYEMDIASISSNADGMPAQNLEFTVTYLPRPAVIPNVPTNPAAPGTPENQVLVQVPTILAPAANTIVAPDENGDYVLTPVADEDTPLANMNLDDHACCVLHFLLMLLALILLIFYTSSMKKRQARIFELDEKLRIEKAKRGLDQGKKDVK